MSRKPSLGRLLSPRSIAVVGASPDPNSVSGRVRTNLRAFGFSGAVHLVSRTRDEVDGERCLRSVDELPHGVDVVIVMTPQDAVVPTIEACTRVGAGSAVVFASGFAETGSRGAEQQQRIRHLAMESGMTVLGPNCLGLVNFHDRVPLTFEELSTELPSDGPRVCIIGQSGAMTANTRLSLLGRGLRVSYSISTGNEAATGLEDFLTHLVDAEEVDAFALFAESLRRPAEFLQACARARQLGKPVVLLHPGRSMGAREAARSHTGALAGDHDVMRVLCAHEGVALVETLDELFDTTALLARYPSASAAEGIAVISNSGAMGGLSIDLCDDLKVPLPTLAQSTSAALAKVLPDYVIPSNPLDLTTAGMQRPALFGESAKAVLDDPGIGSLMIALMGGGEKAQLAKADALLPVLTSVDKPSAMVIMGDCDPLATSFLKRVEASHVPFFRSPDRALRALAAAQRRAKSLHAQERRLRLPIPVTSERAVPPGPLAEYKGKRLLADMGLSVPAGELARHLDDALQIAGRIGYPVVLKAQADALTHKSDVGGVAVNLPDADALTRAWSRMHTDIERLAHGVVIDGVLVERMSRKGDEFIIGARRDPAWGLVLMIGSGGIWIEAMRDVLLIPADLNREQITEQVQSLKGAALLRGLRGRPPGDIDALVTALRTLGDYLAAHPDIVEVDINPFVVFEKGLGAMALDAVFIGADDPRPPLRETA